jgi:nucleotide-binding universal stress UspA family protein
MGQIAIPSIDVELDKRASEELSNLGKKEIPPDIKSKMIVKTGKPFVEIIETASEEDIDLIIIATHGHTGIEHVLFGSTAEKVIRKAPCPVLTLREPIKGFEFKAGIKKEK